MQIFFLVNVRVPGVSIKACNQYSKCVASCKTSLLLSVHSSIVYKIYGGKKQQL